MASTKISSPETPDLLASVEELLGKFSDWKSVHESHLLQMRTAAKGVAEGRVSDPKFAVQDLVAAAQSFLKKVDGQGWVIHESHLSPIRAGIEQETPVLKVKKTELHDVSIEIPYNGEACQLAVASAREDAEDRAAATGEYPASYPAWIEGLTGSEMSLGNYIEAQAIAAFNQFELLDTIRVKNVLRTVGNVIRIDFAVSERVVVKNYVAGLESRLQHVSKWLGSGLPANAIMSVSVDSAKPGAAGVAALDSVPAQMRDFYSSALQLVEVKADLEKRTLSPLDGGRLRERTLCDAFEKLALSCGVALRAPMHFDSRGEVNIVIEQPLGGGKGYGDEFASLLNAHQPRCGVMPGALLTPGSSWCSMNHFEVEKLVLARFNALQLLQTSPAAEPSAPAAVKQGGDGPSP